MDRIQWALHKQLKGSYDVARMTLSEQTEELSRAKAAREDIGVQLYQMQQQLAKLQMNLEKVHENHSIIAQMREAAEDDQRRQGATAEWGRHAPHGASARGPGRHAGGLLLRRNVPRRAPLVVAIEADHRKFGLAHPRFDRGDADPGADDIGAQVQ